MSLEKKDNLTGNGMIRNHRKPKRNYTKFNTHIRSHIKSRYKDKTINFEGISVIDSIIKTQTLKIAKESENLLVISKKQKLSDRCAKNAIRLLYKPPIDIINNELWSHDECIPSMVDQRFEKLAKLHKKYVERKKRHSDKKTGSENSRRLTKEFSSKVSKIPLQRIRNIIKKQYVINRAPDISFLYVVYVTCFIDKILSIIVDDCVSYMKSHNYKKITIDKQLISIVIRENPLLSTIFSKDKIYNTESYYPI